MEKLIEKVLTSKAVREAETLNAFAVAQGAEATPWS